MSQEEVLAGLSLPKRSLWAKFVRFIDSESFREYSETELDKIDWRRATPFVLLHLALFLVFFVGTSPVAYVVGLCSYLLRGFAITGFYHRYFSHKSFSTSRVFQFIFATVGCSALQRGPLWWCAHHRDHHSFADSEDDPHSPRYRGFWYSHMGWFMYPKHFKTRVERIPDFIKYPELRFLNRFDLVVPFMFAMLLFMVGVILENVAPQWGTSGIQMVVWGFLVPTLFIFHVTAAVNSLCHRFGSRPYATKDSSRNNPLVALFALGEGWHNNHHRLPYVVRQGFRWYEYDFTYYVLRLMASVGLIWDLKEPPAKMPS